MPEPHLRASDADRTAVADVLGGHMSAGRLTVAEYDDRLARAFAARTYGELAELTADLPVVQPAAQPQPQPAAGNAGCGAPGAAGGWAHGRPGGWGPWAGGGWGARAGGVGLRAAWASWIGTAVIVVGIWAVSCLASWSWIYPWPLWVLGPWGVVLLAQFLGGDSGRGRGRNRNRDRDRRPERQRG
jgi:hypothetical protein